MRTLLAVLISTGIASTNLVPSIPPALAGFSAPDRTPSSISVECAVVRVVPQDRDPNPGYKVTVYAQYDDGVLKSMDVWHTRVNGQQVDRSAQYSNARLVQHGNIATWIGYRGGLQMTGVLDPNKMTYQEYITRNNHLETEIDTRCHIAEGE
jgi:hypothetical protein